MSKRAGVIVPPGKDEGISIFNCVISIAEIDDLQTGRPGERQHFLLCESLPSFQVKSCGTVENERTHFSLSAYLGKTFERPIVNLVYVRTNTSLKHHIGCLCVNACFAIDALEEFTISRWRYCSRDQRFLHVPNLQIPIPVVEAKKRGIRLITKTNQFQPQHFI